MIIDITVKNFRSIKDEQTFSLYTENKTEHLASNVHFPIDGKIGVLKVAGIYGANASGKSNLLLAFKALQYLAIGSGDLKDGDSISSYEPYLLSTFTKAEATTFEIEFVMNSIRYLYNVSYKSAEIVSESLNFYPGSQPANIFNREEGQTWKEISFGSLYKGGKKRIPFFNNNTYLSKAGNSADSPPIIQEVFQFFRTGIMRVGVSDGIHFHRWKENPEIVNVVSLAVQNVDLGIKGFEFKKIEVDELKIPDFFPDKLKEKFKEKFHNDLGNKTMFHHLSEGGGVEVIPESEESDGTIRFFQLMPLAFLAIKAGTTLIFDEIEKHLHPHIAEVIIKLFQDSSVNTRGAQLIFSTHNINLMSPDILRRDQVWFSEKKDGASSIYSLDEYDKSTVKNTSPFAKWYDEGRFGAIPQINYAAIATAKSFTL